MIEKPSVVLIKSSGAIFLGKWVSRVLSEKSIHWGGNYSQEGTFPWLPKAAPG